MTQCNACFLGGTDYSPFSYEVISSGINDTATFYLDEEIRNTSKCTWGGVWGRFPNNESEIKLTWLWNWVIETTSSKSELYFKVCTFIKTNSAEILLSNNRLHCDNKCVKESYDSEIKRFAPNKANPHE